MCVCVSVRTCVRACVRACMRTCVRDVFVHTCVRACVQSGNSVIARVLCFSVCQFDFALYDYVYVITCDYAIDFCVSIYAFHAFV